MRVLKRASNLIWCLLLCFVPIHARPPSLRFRHYISRLFHEAADVNKDGTISFDECYQTLLLFYTYLNQYAPIPPPKRERVLELYKSADWDSRSGLQESEFQLLAGALASRATLRVGLYKAVTWIVAPLFTSFLVQQLEGTKVVDECRSALVSREWIPEMVKTKSFWVTALLVANVSNLGMLVLYLLDEVLLTRFKPMQRFWIPEKLRMENANAGEL